MSTLPTRIQKQIAGKCCYSGCRDDAMDGSDYCEPHDAHERGRAANRQRRHRQKVADAGLCIAGCGRKVARQRGKDGRVKRRRCATCRKEHRKQAQNARARMCVTGEERGVTGNASDLSVTGWRVTLEQSPDGIPRERSRYVGQGKRGRQSIEKLDEQDRAEAVRHLELGVAGLRRLNDPEVRALPPIQRAEVTARVLDQLQQARRWIAEIHDRHSPKSRKAEERSEDD